MNQTIWQLDAFALAEQFRQHTLDPVDVLTVYQERIDRLNPVLNAIICHHDKASDDARASAARHARGEALSPIDGLPIVIKDNLAVKGMPATFGSKLYADFLPAADEIPVELLRRAGAVILGKTNVPEFCVEGFTDNELFGLTCNPWDPAVTPGGSSGGSVCSVAAAMAPLAIGTDGGGSVRRPAAYTNLVGLKTSIGRIPRGGGLPQLLLDMEVIGPLTRSVRDQAMLLDVMARPDSRDHRSLTFARSTATESLARAPGQLRILAVKHFGAAPLDPDISNSFDRMTDTLTGLGHHVEAGELPLNIEPVNERWASIGAIGLSLLLRRKPQMRELAGSKYVDWAEQDFSAATLLDIIETIGELRDQAALAFTRFDIIMTPTCAAMPWTTDMPFPPTINGQEVGPRGSAIYTGWVNACGHPAVTVPGVMSPDGMPIGTQFVGGLGRDEGLLQLAAQIEAVQPWAQHWPALAL